MDNGKGEEPFDFLAELAEASEETVDKHPFVTEFWLNRAEIKMLRKMKMRKAIGWEETKGYSPATRATMLRLVGVFAFLSIGPIDELGELTFTIDQRGLDWLEYHRQEAFVEKLPIILAVASLVVSIIAVAASIAIPLALGK